MRRNASIFIAALPAIFVVGASLFALLGAVTQVAVTSKPGELLYALREPISELQGELTNDGGTHQAFEEQLVRQLPAPTLETSATAQSEENTIPTIALQPTSTMIPSATATPLPTLAPTRVFRATNTPVLITRFAPPSPSVPVKVTAPSRASAPTKSPPARVTETTDSHSGPGGGDDGDGGDSSKSGQSHSNGDSGKSGGGEKD